MVNYHIFIGDVLIGAGTSLPVAYPFVGDVLIGADTAIPVAYPFVGDDAQFAGAGT